MSYKERLDKLVLNKNTKLNISLIKEVQDIDLTFDFATNNTISELSDFVKNFMKKYNIGTKISKRFWGIRGFKKIQQNIYDKLKKQIYEREPITPHKLYDDLQSDVDGKKNVDYQQYQYARVARTEGKTITTIYQLEKFKEAGLKYVRHVTKGDNKVATICALHNNKEDEIDWLLSDKGEASRPPRHINCRCRVTASMRGL